jgi:hypothetical protein
MVGFSKEAGGRRQEAGGRRRISIVLKQDLVSCGLPSMLQFILPSNKNNS